MKRRDETTGKTVFMSEKISSKKDDDISMRIDGNQNPYRAKEEEKVREMQKNATAEPNALQSKGRMRHSPKGKHGSWS